MFSVTSARDVIINVPVFHVIAAGDLMYLFLILHITAGDVITNLPFLSFIAAGGAFQHLLQVAMVHK